MRTFAAPTPWSRRIKVIPVAFSERVGLPLVYAALIGAVERWRAIGILQCPYPSSRQNGHGSLNPLIQQ
jgi:hypothetical protein